MNKHEIEAQVRQKRKNLINSPKIGAQHQLTSKISVKRLKKSSDLEKQLENALLGIRPVVDIIQLATQTAYLKPSDYPTNILLIARPESAKTSIMDLFKIKGTYTTNNITQAVLVSKFLSMIETQGLKHIIIPDFLNAIEKDTTTRQGFLNMIKSLMEEGITSLDTFNIRTNKVYDPPIQCGLITGITTDKFNGYYDAKNHHYRGGVKFKWRSMGLLSRFVPFSYEYDLSKILKIYEQLEKEELQKPKVQLKIKRANTKIKGNYEIFRKYEGFSLALGELLGGYGFRLQRNLQQLTKANALLNGRTEVNDEDFKKILGLTKWINFKCNAL